MSTTLRASCLRLYQGQMPHVRRRRFRSYLRRRAAGEAGPSVAAVEAGEIGFAHFAHIANASAKVGERLDETTLLCHGRKETVARFRETCIHARHADLAEPGQDRKSTRLNSSHANI